MDRLIDGRRDGWMDGEGEMYGGMERWIDGWREKGGFAGVGKIGRQRI